MCGRFVATAPISELAEHFHVDEIKVEGETEPRYNVAPTLEVLAVAESRRDGARRLGPFKWGLVPSWAKDPTIGSKLINARAESVIDKPSFRTALSRRRCIIPADAFYEWRRPPGGEGAKQPFVIRHADGSPLAFAGLWEVWRPSDASEDDEWLRTCTIITTEANELVSELHDRMPVVLPPDNWDHWLDPGEQEANAVVGLLTPAPADEFEIYPVSTDVNNVRNEGPQLVDRIDG